MSLFWAKNLHHFSGVLLHILWWMNEKNINENPFQSSVNWIKPNTKICHYERLNTSICYAKKREGTFETLLYDEKRKIVSFFFALFFSRLNQIREKKINGNLIIVVLQMMTTSVIKLSAACPSKHFMLVGILLVSLILYNIVKADWFKAHWLIQWHSYIQQ